MYTIGDNIRYYRESKGMLQEELAKLAGVSRQTIGMLERNKIKRPKLTTLKAIADILEVDVNKLNSKIRNEVEPIKLPEKLRTVKVLGSVPAGPATEAFENDTGETIQIDANLIRNNNEVIALNVVGDSMYPRFIEGDTIVLEITNQYKNGDYVIATINDYETTLKQIFTNGNITTLHPINPEYPDKRYSSENDRLSVFGVVRELRRKI